MKRIKIGISISALVLGLVILLTNCTSSRPPSPGQLVIQLDDAFVTTREDSSWAKLNSDTFTAYVYSADETLVANASASDDHISLDVDKGNYKVVLLAGDKRSANEVLLLAAGASTGVGISSNETTTITVALKPVQLHITSLPLAETGQAFHASMHGSFPIDSLRLYQAPTVSLGSGTGIAMNFTNTGANWSALAQMTALPMAATDTLHYQGGLLALQDETIGNQPLNLGGYSWKLFTGDTSPYTSHYSQSIEFRNFTTVCASGCDFSTIQAAINAASSGDDIAVRPGRYDENLVIDKALTLYGATWDLIKDNDYPVPANYAWDEGVESIIVTQGADTDGNSIDIRDTDDVIFQGFVAESLNTTAGNRQLLRLYALNRDIHNIRLINNIIGPNTNLMDPSNYGRMGLYLVPHYGDYGIKNSLISHNKIVGSGGNGNNIFVWGGNNADGLQDIADLDGTVIEYNDIYGSRRSGIEVAGGAKNLTIRHNKIHDNGFSDDDASGSDYKYGNGIVLIRVGSESSDPDAPGIENFHIENNQIYNNKQFGIYLGPKNGNHTINGNDIYNNAWDALQVDMVETYHGGTNPLDTATSNISFNYNNIYNNGSYGARVVGEPVNGFILDARYNWWGAASGPGPVGDGDDVTPLFVDTSGYANQPLE